MYLSFCSFGTTWPLHCLKICIWNYYFTLMHFKCQKCGRYTQEYLKPEFSLWLNGLRTLHSVGDDAGSIPGLTRWVKNLVSSKAEMVGCRCGLDPALLWLWCRLAAAAPISPLAWELPYAAGGALKSKRKNKLSMGLSGGVTGRRYIVGKGRRCLHVEDYIFFYYNIK